MGRPGEERGTATEGSNDGVHVGSIGYINNLEQTRTFPNTTSSVDKLQPLAIWWMDTGKSVVFPVISKQMCLKLNQHKLRYYPTCEFQIVYVFYALKALRSLTLYIIRFPFL